MAVIRTAAFSFRDFLESILPTIVALCLFMPYVSSFNSFDLAFLAVALLGYAISSPVIAITKKIYRYFPIVGQKIKSIEEEKEWWSNNWDYSKLFYRLKSDEREYIYLTAAYASCFRTMSFYFLIYAIIQTVQLSKAFLAVKANPCQWIEAITKQATPMFGGWELPSFVVLIVSIIFVIFLLRDFLSELHFLFDDDGQYALFATNYQEEKGKIAKSIWGTVSFEHEKVNGAKVILLNTDRGVQIDETLANTQGKFQFKNKFQDSNGSKCRIEASKDNVKGFIDIQLSDKQVPEFMVKLEKAPK